MHQINRGFYEIVPRELISIFDARELEVCGALFII